ncbi:MAG TPA: malto-oligosyltrehalose trehalohydrolase [Terriglobales bacterium]|nr:malto-oligosyltrehalose trehalohydrolase [Terriglobales bacterium]
MEKTLTMGTTLHGNVCHFRVWAPLANGVSVALLQGGAQRDFQMERQTGGYFHLTAPAVAGDRYFYQVDGGRPVPDPVSRLLPDGVHGATEIIDPGNFAWGDDHWRGLDMARAILYELHTGTFTREGDFEAIIGKLHYLKSELGVTAIELMPVAAVPRDENGQVRNWGYDGVSPYSVEAVYGGPAGLKRLVNAAHATGLAVVLDVVYNHLGNEGNYLARFAPYFTERHQTPWGNAVDFSNAEVRGYFVENALFWVREYHLDGLRLDAVQTIHDDSAKHILQEIAEEVHAYAEETGRKIWVIAETDTNDRRLVQPRSAGGYGLDAFWSDDFHHAMHTVLTGEDKGYYQDFGKIEQMAKALNEGYVFQGEHFKFWDGARGTPAAEIELPKNVICIQNHDQVGNRAKGERLTQLASWAQRRAAAALMLLAPHTPMLFMGEEFDNAPPFQFFTSYGDPSLKEAVRNGRCQEFRDFAWEEIPDPENPQTFHGCKLPWEQLTNETEMLNWYQELIALRKKFVIGTDRTCRATVEGSVLTMEVPREQALVRVDVNFKGNPLPEAPHGFAKALFAADEGCAVAVYRAV